jgi:long-chain fatty acid transport protein
MGAAAPRARRFAPIAALLVLATPSGAGAGSLFELAGAPTTPNGYNARVFGRGTAAAYFNPGHLGRIRKTTEIGVAVLVTHADIELLERPASVDVPDAVYLARPPESDGAPALRPLPTEDLPEPRVDTAVRDVSSYATIGVTHPLVAEALVFGFYGMLPIQSFHRQRSFFPDEREQYFSNQLHFELLGDRAELASFAVALGGQAFEWLGVGAGVDVTIGTRAITYGYVPDGSDQRTVLLNPDITVESVFAPHAGIVATVHEGTNVTATVHLPVSSDVDGENRLRFFNFRYPEGADFVLQTYAASLGYTPLRASLGASHEARSWELGGHVLYARWSEYRNRHAARPLDAWSDTVSLHLGGALLPARRRISADIGFVPSPVPAQRGRENYVDNARLTSTLGYEAPLAAFGVPVRLGFHLQGQVLLPRRVTKASDARHPVLDEFPDGSVNGLTGQPIPESEGLQTNNPGYPGFSSAGFLVGAGLSLTVPDMR